MIRDQRPEFPRAWLLASLRGCGAHALGTAATPVAASPLRLPPPLRPCSPETSDDHAYPDVLGDITSRVIIGPMVSVVARIAAAVNEFMIPISPAMMT